MDKILFKVAKALLLINMLIYSIALMSAKIELLVLMFIPVFIIIFIIGWHYKIFSVTITPIYHNIYLVFYTAFCGISFILGMVGAFLLGTSYQADGLYYLIDQNDQVRRISYYTYYYISRCPILAVGGFVLFVTLACYLIAKDVKQEND